MKDIFIDNNIASNIAMPLTEPYKIFTKWLFNEGALVINSKLHGEYVTGNQLLSTVVDKLTKDGRLNIIKNDKLNSFKFTKTEENNFLSNFKDRIHIKSVLLSNRKLAVSLDRNFITDINNFRKVDKKKSKCEDCPSKLNYK